MMNPIAKLELERAAEMKARKYYEAECMRLRARAERYLRQVENPWIAENRWLVCVACGERYDKHAEDCAWKKLQED